MSETYKQWLERKAMNIPADEQEGFEYRLVASPKRRPKKKQKYRPKWGGVFQGSQVKAPRKMMKRKHE